MRRLLLVLAVALVCAPGTAQPQVFTTGTPAELALARARALEHLRATAGSRGIDPDDLAVSSAHVDQLSMAHVRVQQSFRGVPVFGGEALVHFRADGSVFAETDALVLDIAVSTMPQLTPADAVARAAAEENCANCVTPPPPVDLWVLRREGVDHLVYRVRMRLTRSGGPPGLPVLFVDAHSGDLVWRYNDLQTGGLLK